jgi:hypothetical protein
MFVACNVGGGVDIAVRLAVGIGDTFVDIVVNLSVGVRVVSCVIGVADGGNVMNGSVKGGGVGGGVGRFDDEPINTGGSVGGGVGGLDGA